MSPIFVAPLEECKGDATTRAHSQSFRETEQVSGVILDEVLLERCVFASLSGAERSGPPVIGHRIKRTWFRSSAYCMTNAESICSRVCLEGQNQPAKSKVLSIFPGNLNVSGHCGLPLPESQMMSACDLL